MAAYDMGEDEEFEANVAELWKAANQANLSDEDRREFQNLLREYRDLRREHADLIEARNRFGNNVRTEMGGRLVPGLVSLFEGGATPTTEEIQAYFQESVAEAVSLNEQPLKALTPNMSSQPIELAELPDAVYLALGRLVVRFGQVEASVTQILDYLSRGLGTESSDVFTDDLSERRKALLKVADEARQKGFLTQIQQKRLKSFLDKTGPLARERRGFIHAGYMRPKDSPSKAGLILRADRKKPGVISLERIDVDEIVDLADRTKAVAQEGWDLYYAILDSNKDRPNKP